MSVAGVRKFCSEVEFPDVSALVAEPRDVDECYAAVWRVIQHMLDAPDQAKFLKTLCDCCAASSDNPYAQRVSKLGRLVNASMDGEQLNTVFELIMMVPLAVQLFGQAVSDFGRTQSLGGIPNFMQMRGLESVVSGFMSTFPLQDERMLYALDRLVCDSNPEQFVQSMDRIEKDGTDDRKSRMKGIDTDIQNLKLRNAALGQQLADSSQEDDADIQKLTLRKAALERQLAGSPQTPPTSSRGKRALGSQGGQTRGQPAARR